ncbi:MAG: molybdate-binding protein, partial [Actinobacteria bacterium]|nr:molybdate-binding protein [Actinomycetota bacterium]
MNLTVAVGIVVTGSLIALGAAPVTNAATPNAYIAPSGTITISAASSLTDVLPVIAAAFTKRFPKVTVKFNFAGSTTLVEQLNAGAP